MTKNKHRIQKVFLEIDTHSVAMANSIKNNLAVFIQNELVPILEKQFNLIENTDNQIVQIEKLEISIHSDTGKTDLFISNNEAKNDLKNQIQKEISKAFNEAKKTTKEAENSLKLSSISTQDKDLKTLLYFIENGSMPWWISKEDEAVFFEKIDFENLKNDVFTVPFRKLIQQKEVQHRIVNQFSNHEIALLTSALLSSEFQQKALLKNDLLQVLNKKTHAFKASFWQLIFDVSNDKKPLNLISFYQQKQQEFTSEKLSFELFIQNIKAFFPINMSDDELKKINDNYLNSGKQKSNIQPQSSIENTSEYRATKDENSPSFTPEIRSTVKEELSINSKKDFQEKKSISKSCYVQNAGLIVLHPFLKELLKSCSLIEDNKILDKELAAHLLHYAATKKENDYEHAMLFEKFLCGIPLQQSIQKEIKIEDQHKQQVEEMLLSVVEHWTALKNTSTDVVRTEFIQREGKLDWSESNPKLTIERKTQDFLLEKIPWNITIIKIPWIENLIYTQW